MRSRLPAAGIAALKVVEGEVMWHRGWDHEQERRQSWYPEQADDGPWNYVVFYRRAVVPAEFVVLAVRSRIQIADRIWETDAERKLTRACSLRCPHRG